MNSVQGPFLPHRRVTTADTTNPTDNKTDGGIIDVFSWDRIVFELNYDANGGTKDLQVTPLWWNVESAAWMSDSEQGRQYVEDGTVLMTVSKRARYCWLKVTTINGGASKIVTIRASLQKARLGD